MNPKAKIIVVLCAFLGFASVSYSQAIITGTRDLPDSYVPGLTITVSLDLSIDETRRPDKWGGILKDFVPAGWTFVSASRDPDSWDPDTGEMKWAFLHGLLGLEMTDTSMDISYQVTPPSGETGDKTFLGQILYNDPDTGNPITETIGGDTVISGPPPVLPIVGFISSSSSGSEAAIDVTLDVALSPTSAEEVTVGYAVTGGTAAGEGEDYTLAAGTLIFSAGSILENISITVNDDLLDEENETIIVTLSSPTNATLGTNTIHTYTIQDDETQTSVEFEVASSEDPESVGTAELTVNLLAQSGLEITVDYAVTGGDATSGEDYTLLGSGTLTFPPGDTSEKISITIINDLKDENNETIEVTLSDPTNAILGAKKIHTYTILEDSEDIPAISFSITGSQGDEAVSPVTMAVNLSRASAKTVTVSYTLSGDADEGADYTTSPPSLTFTPGETTKNITLSIVDDGLNETDETVTVTLSNPNNASLGANIIYTYTISDNDIAGIGFALVSSSGPESVTDVTLVVVLSPEAVNVVTVNYAVTGGTADGGGVDYTHAAGTLTFPAGDTSKEITITINDDSIYEGDETIEVTLSTPTNAELGTNIIHTYTIVDNETELTVGFKFSASEGLEDNSPAELIVKISGESSQDVQVDYSVTPGTAKAFQDYTPVGGTLTFPAGDTEPKIILIPIIDNELNEDDETFTVELNDPENTILGTASHTYTILDNDDPPEVSFTSAGAQGDEDVSPVTMDVNLSEESGRTVTVGYSVSGTATRGEDYILDDGTLIFLPGETSKDIILTILNDDFGEPTEKVIVTLNADSETVEPGAPMQYTYTILDDDDPSVSFAAVSSQGPEANSPAILTVVLSPYWGSEVTVEYNVDLAGTAQAPEDYTAFTPGTLIFPTGDQAAEFTLNIEIDITPDTDVEPDETIIVTLSNPTGALIGANESHTYTILNDDDNTLPEISDFIPEPDSIQVARDTIIQVRITDEMISERSGVALDTVSISIEGVVVYSGDTLSYTSDMGICRRVEITEDADYLFVFQQHYDSLFDYEQQVNVVVNAKDNAGNDIEADYDFYTVMRLFGPNIQVNSFIGDLVPNNPATASAQPATARDFDDNILVVFQTNAAGGNDIYIAKLLAGESVFEDSVPVFSGAHNQSNPAIAVDRSNKIIHVVFQGYPYPRGNWDIFHSSSTDGTDWSIPKKVNREDDPNPSDQTSPTIAVDQNGKVSVAYVCNSAGDKNIVVATSTDGGSTWVATLVTTDTSAQTEPFITIDDVDDTAYIFLRDERNAGTNGTDIYVAKSPSWVPVPLVETVSNQLSPVGVVSNRVIHLLWVDDENDPRSILYGNNEDVQPFTGTDIVDEPGTWQRVPSIAFNGKNIFACWEDARNLEDDNADWDIYFAESGSDYEFGTNILVNDDLGANAQTAPVIGTDKDGNPYMGWVDNRLGDNIFGVATTSVGPALAEIDVSAASGGTVEIDDVIVEIPAGALPADIKITIAELVNPPSLPPGGFGVPYEFGPSGLEFSQPVTITILHAATYEHPDHPVYAVYWYDPSILPPASPWTQDGISDVQHLTPSEDSDLPEGVHAVRFKTTHTTGFGTGGGDVGDVLGGEGGGGCEISPTGQGNVIEYMLPYVLLTVVWVIIKRKDARNRKTT